MSVNKLQSKFFCLFYKLHIGGKIGYFEFQLTALSFTEKFARPSQKKVFFGNSGAEANECAVKVARKYAAERKGAELRVIPVAEDGSLGMRVTRDQFSHDICYRLQKPLVSTSANISGEPTARTFREISEEIKSQVDYICSFRRGDNIPGTPSRIIKLGQDCSVKIIR